jgi:hypothetical protein
MHRFFKWQLGEQILPLLEWQCGHVAAIDPHDVKDVIRHFAAAPRDLAVKDQFVVWKTFDCVLNCEEVLRQVVT